MGLLRNLLALVGLIAVAGVLYAVVLLKPVIAEFDPGYFETYKKFATKLLETKDPGSAMVYSVRVNKGISVEDVKDSLKSLASARNFLFVGEAPFYKQVQAVTNQPYRHISFLSFCDAKVGKLMADYNDVYTAFMPCRISVVEDKSGNLWLHTMALDLMIHGGKQLPPELKTEAIRIWKTIKEIMDGAAKGDI
ncbi:MAG: DUF302 domain-containing protein [Magnetococcales bacterium]|nr:DUF302 domain-containing protein [Magnetococcales bacterium]